MKGGDNMFLGLLILVLGVIFLLQALGVWTTNVGDVIWPVVLIVFGISMLTKRGGCGKCCSWMKKGKDDSGDTPA